MNLKAYILILLCIIPLGVSGEPEPEREYFDFRKTVAIYHLLDGGGIIYVRPDEYSETQGFIRIYEALDDYLFELNQQTNDITISLDELPLLDELLLVTRSTQKQYLLKEGWLGDGEQWVPMGAQDFKKLKDMLDARRDLEESKTDDEGLANFTAEIHGSSGEDITPDYHEQFSISDEDERVAPGKEGAGETPTNDDEDGTKDHQEAEDGYLEDNSYKQKVSENATTNSSQSFRNLKNEPLGKLNSVSTNEERRLTPSGTLLAGSSFIIILLGGVFYVRSKRNQKNDSIQ